MRKFTIAHDCEHISKPHDLYDDYMSSRPKKDLKKQFYYTHS